MQLAVSFLVATAKSVDWISKLHLTMLKLVESMGQKRVLPKDINPLKVYDPWDDRDVDHEPSYEINDCLVSVCGWGFWESNLSVIIVGVPEKVQELKSIFAKPFEDWRSRTRAIDWEYEKPPSWHESFKTYEAPDGLDWWDTYHYAELLAKDLREGGVFLTKPNEPTP
jgi:hypothetical protein